MILARNPHPNMRGVFMNPEDELELQKRRLIDNVRESVEKELKKRYSWLGIMVLLITSGLYPLLRLKYQNIKNFIISLLIRLIYLYNLVKNETKNLRCFPKKTFPKIANRYP
jgi:hypothetical protein